MKDNARWLLTVTLPLIAMSWVARADDFTSGPHWVGGLILPSRIVSLAVNGGALYLSTDDGRLRTYDLADPARLTTGTNSDSMKLSLIR
jgi:hypothetical protein